MPWHTASSTVTEKRKSPRRTRRARESKLKSGPSARLLRRNPPPSTSQLRLTPFCPPTLSADGGTAAWLRRARADPALVPIQKDFPGGAPSYALPSRRQRRRGPAKWSDPFLFRPLKQTRVGLVCRSDGPHSRSCDSHSTGMACRAGREVDRHEARCGSSEDAGHDTSSSEKPDVQRLASNTLPSLRRWKVA
jgi:hypothetical protein